MQINNISNKNIYFGYNKEYHAKVQEYLKSRKQNQALANMLAQSDSFSLKLEDEIIKLEKEKGKTHTLAFKTMSDWLREYKQTLALYLDLNFPKLEYAKNISEQCQKEIKEIKDVNAIGWRKALSDNIQYLNCDIKIPETYDSPTETQNQIQKNKQTTQETEETKKTIEEIRAQAIDDYENSKANEVLELFRPNASSPRGFIDVMGMEDMKEKFQDEILGYIKNPELKKKDEEEYGIKAPRGYLFYGPPGCGKTYIVQALAQETNLPMYKIDISKVGTKFINQTAQNIQIAFDFIAAQNEKHGTQSLLFMDEVDGIAIGRGKMTSSSEETIKVTSSLLKLIEGAREKGIIVIAATNKYDLLDEAFKARFDGQVYFGLPDEEQIKKLLIGSLSKRSKGIKLSQNSKAIENLAKELKGYSNRSITFIVDEAAKLARKRNRSDIDELDLKEAIEKSELEKPKEKEYHKASKQNKIGFRNI